MHDQFRHDLEAAITEMSEAEKRSLLHYLEQSLQSNGKPARTTVTRAEAETVTEQKRAWRELAKRVAELPRNEPDDGLVASRDHDRILYDGMRKTGFGEKPLT